MKYSFIVIGLLINHATSIHVKSINMSDQTSKDLDDDLGELMEKYEDKDLEKTKKIEKVNK